MLVEPLLPAPRYCLAVLPVEFVFSRFFSSWTLWRSRPGTRSILPQTDRSSPLHYCTVGVIILHWDC